MTKTARDSARPTTAADWRATLDDLAARTDVVATEAATLDAGRAADALTSSLGDIAAKARLAERDDRLAVLARECRDLDAAATAARAELAGAEKREADARRAANEREAVKITAEALVVAERLDAAIAQSATDAIELERLLSRASHFRGGSSDRAALRVERAVRGAYWRRGLKVGEFTQREIRVPLVEGLASLLGVAPAPRPASPIRCSGEVTGAAARAAR